MNNARDKDDRFILETVFNSELSTGMHSSDSFSAFVMDMMSESFVGLF